MAGNTYRVILMKLNNRRKLTRKREKISECVTFLCYQYKFLLYFLINFYLLIS